MPERLCHVQRLARTVPDRHRYRLEQLRGVRKGLPGGRYLFDWNVRLRCTQYRLRQHVHQHADGQPQLRGVRQCLPCQCDLHWRGLRLRDDPHAAHEMHIARGNCVVRRLDDESEQLWCVQHRLPGG